MIDREKLMQMMDGNSSLVDKMIDSFRTQTKEQIPQLIDYTSSNQLDKIELLAHNIKTQSMYLGLKDISLLAKKIEHHSQNREDLNLWKDKIELLIKGLQKYL